MMGIGELVVDSPSLCELRPRCGLELLLERQTLSSASVCSSWFENLWKSVESVQKIG